MVRNFVSNMTRIEDINKASIEHASEVDEAYKYSYKDGFIDGSVWADNHPKSPWISVKEKLPCEFPGLIESVGTITGVPVLIATQNRVTLGIRIKAKDGKWYWCENIATLSPMIEEVMFWMQIPEIPKI